MHFLKSLIIAFISSVCMISQKANCFLPDKTKALAISCGETKLYTDKANGILYIPDTYRKGGTISRRDETKFQPRKTIFNQQYDWNIHKNYVYDKTSFSYILPIKPDRDYSLILIFAEISDMGIGRRLFNILLEGQVIINALDIYQQAGGKQIPYHEIIELDFHKSVLTNKSTGQVISTYKNFEPYLNVTFQSVVGYAKLDALILYEGTFKEIKNHMVETFMYKSNNGKGLTKQELRVFLQGNQITCQSDKEYVFPLRQYFIQKIREQNQFSCPNPQQNQFSESENNGNQEYSGSNEIQILETAEHRKQTLAKLQQSLKASHPQQQQTTFFGAISRSYQNLLEFFGENLLFFGCLVFHFLILHIMFRDMKKKGSENAKDKMINTQGRRLSPQQIINLSNASQNQLNNPNNNVNAQLQPQGVGLKRNNYPS